MRTIIAFITAPVMGLYFWGLVMLALELTFGSRSGALPQGIAEKVLGFLATPLPAVIFGAPMAYFGMFTAGLATRLALHRMGMETLPAYAIAGAIGGALIPTDKPYVSPLHIPTPIQHSATGAMILALFFLLSRR